MYFKGDVIIADPCNIVKSDEEWQLVLADTYDRAELDKIGIQNYLSFEAAGESRGLVKDSDSGNTMGEIVLEQRGEEIAVAGRGNMNFHTEL